MHGWHAFQYAQPLGGDRLLSAAGQVAALGSSKGQIGCIPRQASIRVFLPPWTDLARRTIGRAEDGEGFEGGFGQVKQ